MIARRLRQASKLLKLLPHPVYRKGLRQGVAAAIEHAGALRTLRIGTLLDVGANMGQFALATRAAHPEATIVAFEPLSSPAAVFRRLFAEDAAVRLHAVAAGTEPAETQINVSGREDSSSLLPISETQSNLFPGTEGVSTETIRVERADDLESVEGLARPIVIKLDVQGFELAALSGMPRLLAAADAVYVEVSFLELYVGQPLAAEIIAYLDQRGFELGGVYNLVATAEGAAIQADFLFRRAGSDARDQVSQLAV